jgi:hypothetical protein
LIPINGTRSPTQSYNGNLSPLFQTSTANPADGHYYDMPVRTNKEPAGGRLSLTKRFLEEITTMADRDSLWLNAARVRIAFDAANLGVKDLRTIRFMRRTDHGRN